MRSKLSSKVVVAVLALFLVLSVGYALFSESIQINGNATAKGTFNIEATCSTEISSNMKNSLKVDRTENGFKNPTCTVSDDVVSYSTDLDYPGAIKYYEIKFTNTGDITAQIDFSSIVQAMQAGDTVERYNYDTDELIDSVSGNFLGYENEGIAFEKADGTFVTSEDELFSEFVIFDAENNPVKILLKPGTSMYWVTKTEWPTEKEYSEKGVYYKASQSVSFPWSQYTE